MFSSREMVPWAVANVLAVGPQKTNLGIKILRIANLDLISEDGEGTCSGLLIRGAHGPLRFSGGGTSTPEFC